MTILSSKKISARCKKVIDEVARNGGYIMDASAIIQNNATIENMSILTDFTQEYGVYSDGSSTRSICTKRTGFRNNFQERLWHGLPDQPRQ